MDVIKTKRCAIYTRKSVEDGLEMEFNSLDAQREAGEAYIASQKGNGWVCLPDRYDDGGFSGGNTNRPALKKLLEDAKAKLIDIIVVYKIDRLSRSIIDFAELSKKLDQWGVAFVSVTQEINTQSSSGRMMLNILITFAQFEREVIAERVKDKMSASRKKGKWVGGCVPMGYKVVEKKLVPDPDETVVVQRIFQRFLEIQSPKQIAYELNQAKILTKQGKPWDTQHIYRLLNNHAYVGDIFYMDEIWKGEHKALIDRETWELTHKFLKTNAPAPDSSRRIDSMAALKGIIRCGHCNSAMTPTHSERRGRKYYYYHCCKDMKRAESICPIKQVPAGEIEKIVYEQLQKILPSPEIILAIANKTGIRPRDVVEIFSKELWEEITPGERQRLMQLLLERVVIEEDGVTLEIRTAGIKSIMEANNGE